MIELFKNGITTLGFKINIEGNVESPQGRFVIEINEDIFLMFPAKVYEEKAIVNVPSLSFLNLEATEIKAYFEVITDGSFFVPWSGMVVLKEPTKVSAEIEQSIETTYKKVEVSPLKQEIQRNIEDEYGEDSFSSFLKRKGI